MLLIAIGPWTRASLDDRGDGVVIDGENGRHDSGRRIVVAAAAFVDEPQRVVEIECADVHEVAVLTETEPQRTIGVDAFSVSAPPDTSVSRERR